MYMDSRRKFISKLIILIVSIPLIGFLFKFLYKVTSNNTVGKITFPNYKAGHRLWKSIFSSTPDKIHSFETLILGGGASGLSSAYYLSKHQYTDFALIELEDEIGGNAASGRNSTGSYPYGAHYLPVISSEMVELKEFLKEVGVIESETEENGIQYNDIYLCHYPDERLLLHGKWQDGLIPDWSLQTSDKKQIHLFFEMVHQLKYQKGSDSKYLFSLPVETSSSDQKYRELDKISFKEYLTQHSFTNEYLLWYLNYCCIDDYGCSIDKISAWAGLHYFCSRRSSKSNAESDEVLTWPEGNFWLLNKMKNLVKGSIFSGRLVYKIEKKKDFLTLYSLNTKTDTIEQWNCKQLIVAIPHFVVQHISSSIQEFNDRKKHILHYSTWLVTTIELHSNVKEKFNGKGLSWDNVVYGSTSLGFVFSNHQELKSHKNTINLTHYICTEIPRKKLLLMNKEQLWQLVLQEFKLLYDDFESNVISYDIHIWGHGMIQPLVNTVFSKNAEQWQKNILNCIQFVHSDTSSLSVFEQAFYNGVNASKSIIQNKV